MEKNILFTHTDLDGVGCAILLKSFIKIHAIHSIGHGPDNKIDREIQKHLAIYDCKNLNVFITDISPNTETMFQWLIDNCKTLTVLDHHKTQSQYTKFKQFIYDNEKCGTLLVKNYLENNGKWVDDKIDDWNYFVELVNDYDLWHLKHDFSKDLNNLFIFMGFSKFLEIFTNKPDLIHNYAEIIEILQRNEKNYVDNCLLTKKPCFLGEYVFLESFVNEVCNEIARNNKDSIGIGINMKNKSVSLRSIGTVDVSSIATANGGGGHKNSAGFSFETLEEIQNFIKKGNKNDNI